MQLKIQSFIVKILLSQNAQYIQGLLKWSKTSILRAFVSQAF